MSVMAMLSDPGTWLAFITLSTLEIILGIDNIIILTILVSRLPPARQASARFTGLSLAMLTRIALLFSIVWLTRLTRPLFELAGIGFSGRDIALFGGGLFLLGKSVLELHDMIKDLHRLVTNQHEQLEGIAHAAETAESQTRKAVSDLEKAKKAQKSCVIQ